MKSLSKIIFSAITISPLVIACTAAQEEESPVSSSHDALVAEATANADVLEQIELLRDAGWTGGEADKARVKHTPEGDVVAFPLTYGADAAADVVYTTDDKGEHVVAVIPSNATSAKAIHATASGSPPDDVLSDADLAKIVAEPDEVVPTTALQPESRGCGSANLAAGESLHRGQRITSCHNGYYLIMQHDGNLVVYSRGGAAMWATGTNGKGGYRATMQRDGNFVVYNANGKALWATGHRYPGDWLHIHDNGEVVRDSGGPIHWRNNQYCDEQCLGWACKRWTCGYEIRGGFKFACVSLPDNPAGLYHYDVIRGGHTVPGFCGTGTYADWRGDGIACPTTHVLKVLECGPP